VRGGGSSEGRGGSSKDENLAVAAPSIRLPQDGGTFSGPREVQCKTGSASLTVPMFSLFGFGRQIAR
jgi:hypothetical protein